MPQKRSSSLRSSSKATKKSPAKKAAPGKKASTKEKKKSTDSVTLPNNMPLRTKEKAAVYRQEFASLWNPALIRIAMVGGFCFVVFGASMAMLDSFKGVPMTAQTADSTQPLQNHSYEEPVDLTQYEFPVEVSTDSQQPLAGTVDLMIIVSEAERVKVGVRPGGGTGSTINLGDANKVEDQTWVIPWDTSDVPNGIYRVVVEVENSHTKYGRLRGEFAVENITTTNLDTSSTESQTSSTEEQTSLQTSTSPNETTSDESFSGAFQDTSTGEQGDLLLRFTSSVDSLIEDKEVIRFDAINAIEECIFATLVKLNDGRSIKAAIEPRSDNRYQVVIDTSITSYPNVEYKLRVSASHISKDTGGTCPSPPDKAIASETFFIGTSQELTEYKNTQQPVVEPEPESEPKPTPVSTTPQFKLSHSGTVLTGAVVIRMESTHELTQIGLYARNRSTGNVQFITTATLVFADPAFRVNTTNLNGTGTRLPNGQYEFFARGKNASGQQVTSDSLILSVFNDLTTQSSTVTTPSQPVTTTDTEPWREDLAAEAEYDRISTVDTVVKQTDSLLRSEEDSIRALLRKYAEAEASGDEQAVIEARSNIDAKREEIVFAAKQSGDLEDVSETIDGLIAERVENLQQRVQKFESIKREREQVADSANLDSDGDGISDIDERSLYGTNPENADSDDDGVSDADELVQGRNPTNASENQAIYFESPKESLGLVREDTLSISQILTVPTDEVAERSPGAEGKVEIRGKALPNSFVTVYVFSTPIVVTVKTDADGSFVYTLDRELEDGNHDVYVAVTDNTGSIVAQSNPFSFIKRAQAFTPVDAAESVVVSDESAIAPTSALSSFGTIAGLGVLSLGLILLMLGVTLRLRQPELAAGRIVENDEPVPNKNDTPEPLAVSERKFDHIDASDS